MSVTGGKQHLGRETSFLAPHRVAKGRPWASVLSGVRGVRELLGRALESWLVLLRKKGQTEQGRQERRTLGTPETLGLSGGVDEGTEHWRAEKIKAPFQEEPSCTVGVSSLMQHPLPCLSGAVPSFCPKCGGREHRLWSQMLCCNFWPLTQHWLCSLESFYLTFACFGFLICETKIIIALTS